MTAVDIKTAKLPKALGKVLKGLGDIDGAGLTIIDSWIGNGGGPLRHIKLREVFAPQAKGPADKTENHVIFLTSGLFDHDGERERLINALQEKFQHVEFIGYPKAATLKIVAERMISESDYPPAYRQPLLEAIMQDIKDEPLFGSQEASQLRHRVDNYLATPLTQEWIDILQTRRPETGGDTQDTAVARQVGQTLAKGTPRQITAPKTARFRSMNSNGGSR